MRRLFTFIAAALLSSGAFAQENWTQLINNGNLEGDDLSSYWVQEYRNEGDAERTDGAPNVIEDEMKAGNHCIAVRVRSEEEAGATTERYDTQFFITSSEAIPSGKEMRIRMKVRASKNAHIGTQAHEGPGQYNDYNSFGEFDVTTEWTKWEWKGTVSTNMTQEANTNETTGMPREFRTVAFDLSTTKDGVTFYFDEISLQIRDPQEGGGDSEGWFNLLRHGTFSTDKVNNYTTFTGRNAIDGVDRPGVIVNDPLDGEPALTVAGVGYNGYKQRPQLDEDGNQKIDEETGEPLFDEGPVYVEVNGDTLRANNGQGDIFNNIDDWKAQFFVTVPHKFAGGQKYKMVMWARADKEAQVDTQIHNMPGGYLHHNMFGTLNLTTEWQRFVFGDPDEGDQERTIPGEGNGGYTIAFNCNKTKDDINYYFRFDEFSFDGADVTADERTLGTEDIFLPMPNATEKEATGIIDMTKCLAMLETTSIEDMIEDNKVTMQDGEEDEDPTFSSIGASFFIKFNGEDVWLADDMTPVSIDLEANEDEKNIGVSLYNDGAATEGNYNAVLRFEYSKWLYVFNVTFVPVETYNGISETKMVVTPVNTYFDLSGRRIANPAKGLYIVNGKKVVLK
jgi:hypothetical protein